MVVLLTAVSVSASQATQLRRHKFGALQERPQLSTMNGAKTANRRSDGDGLTRRFRDQGCAPPVILRLRQGLSSYCLCGKHRHGSCFNLWLTNAVRSFRCMAQP